MTVPAYGKRFAAWLGTIAMLLLVCAPTVSHIVATRAIMVPVCSGAAPAEHARLSVEISLDNHHAASGHQSGSHALNDCGYCNLMMHEAALPSLPPALPSPLLLILLALLLPPLHRFTSIGAFPSGRPRAPPCFS